MGGREVRITEDGFSEVQSSVTASKVAGGVS